MPFPYHDRHWLVVVDFLKRHHEPGESIIAPDEFIEEFPEVLTYAATFAAREKASPWSVIHKGMLDRINRDFLTDSKTAGKPVFANEVFIVFTRKEECPDFNTGSPHYASFLTQLAGLPAQAAAPKPNARLKPMRAVGTLTTEEIMEEMDFRYSNPENDEFAGYEHPHRWDQVRFEEVNKVFKRMIGPVTGQAVLELGCGMGRNIGLVGGCAKYVGVDLSGVAISKAGKLHAGVTGCAFEHMDATDLKLGDGQFDLVFAVELVEHVISITKLLSEAFRVLKPGGRFILNSANRDSLHVRMTRKLGYPEFKATREHIREFGYAEMCGLLGDAGFRVAESVGVFLHPYFGIPVVDQPVRRLTDDDPEVVEWLRILGERAGPEFGFEFVVSAVKAA